MRDYPQYEDLGIDPEADKTEDLRQTKTFSTSDAARAATPTASEPTTQLKTETEKF